MDTLQSPTNLELSFFKRAGGGGGEGRCQMSSSVRNHFNINDSFYFTPIHAYPRLVKFRCSSEITHSATRVLERKLETFKIK